MSASEKLNCVAEFLARRDLPDITEDSLKEPVDVLILLGSSLVGPTHVAAQVLRQGLASRVLISGGVGHSSQGLRDAVAAHPKYHSVETQNRTEADILRDIMIDHLGIENELVIVENQSTNCGTNAEESRKVLDGLALSLSSMLVIQDPTMQQRSQACFKRAWQDRPEVEIISYAPFIPVVTEPTPGSFEVTGDTEKIWPFNRFVSLVLGEIPRLRDDQNGYGPNGRNFYDHVDIPAVVLEAYEESASLFADLSRSIPS